MHFIHDPLKYIQFLSFKKKINIFFGILACILIGQCRGDRNWCGRERVKVLKPGFEHGMPVKQQRHTSVPITFLFFSFAEKFIYHVQNLFQTFKQNPSENVSMVWCTSTQGFHHEKQASLAEGGMTESVIAHYPACALRPGGLAMWTEEWQIEQKPSKPLDSFCNVRPCQSHGSKTSLFSPSSRQSFTQGSSQREKSSF